MERVENEEDLIFLGKEIEPTASILSPIGKVLENGMMPRFFRRLSEGVFDIQDLKFRTYELAELIQKCSLHYKFDLRKTIAVGFSNELILLLVSSFSVYSFCIQIYFKVQFFSAP